MKERIPHDYLFKELLSPFFEHFLQLFVPQLAEQIEPGTLRLIDKELYPEWFRDRGRQADLLEHESGSRKRLPRRMFLYYAHFHEKRRRIYPIVLYSYPRPLKPGRNRYSIKLCGARILTFCFQGSS